MINRHEKLITALVECEKAYKQNPQLFPFKSIIRQLKYLIDFEEGNTDDLEPLKNIKIGWIAVRELDGFGDKELIKLLCTISNDTDSIAREVGNKNV